MRHDDDGSPTAAVLDPDRLGELTRRYARYSVSAGGLASVLGGALALTTYFVGALWTPEKTAFRLLMASAPFVWIAAKEGLRAGYYQRLGVAREIRTPADRRLHLGFTLFTAGVSVLVLGVIGWRVATGASPAPEAGGWGYVALVGLMPWLVWRFMKTPLDYIVGVFLVAQAALMLAGSNYELWQQPQVPIVAVALLVVGLRQHRDFLALRQELTGRRAR